MDDRAELTTLLADLVRIDSVNPDLAAGAKGEGDIVAFIAEWAACAGLEVIVQAAGPGRPNLIVIARGSGGGRNLMFNGHVDTVGVSSMDDPFAARIEGGRLYGRGAYDMKAGVAAALIAARRAKTLGLRGDVIVTCVADEEAASIGTQAILQELERWRPDAVIVAEPTEMAVSVAHKGFVWFDVETQGVAAHGSRPHLGVDAIAKMGEFLVEMERLDRELRAHPSHPYLASGSVHAGIIRGGQEVSSYPANCTLQIERRTIPGESPDLAEAQLRAILDRLAASDDQFKALLARGLVRQPFEVHPDEPIVQLCLQHLERVTGQPAAPGGVSFWADSALFSVAGIPAVLLGPIGAGAHGAVEWIDLASVHQCADVFTGVAREFCP